MKLSLFLEYARGERPVNLTLKGGTVVDVYTSSLKKADVSIAGDQIIMVGPSLSAEREVDCTGKYLCPGFIDAHVHIESSLMTPFAFGNAVVPLGTTSVVADPHEIANVAGVKGIHFMIQSGRKSPLSVFYKAPSCVPATPFGTAGANLSADDLTPLLEYEEVIGLAEMMNFPGLVFGDPGALNKMEAFSGQHIDGHSPGQSGPLLQAYAGAGITTDHECMTQDEMNERLSLGMHVLIREGSAAKNLMALLPSITPENARYCSFCTDDRHPAEIMAEGHINYMVKEAVKFGIDPVEAIRLATINSAECFHLKDRGALAPGKRADVLILPDLCDFKPQSVYVGGELVAKNGQMQSNFEDNSLAFELPDTFHVKDRQPSLNVPYNGGLLNVIETIPDQLLTKWEKVEPAVLDGHLTADTEKDILKIAVVERHLGSGNVGIGFIKGFGLKTGAIAGSVGHDAHNLTVVGCDDQSMQTAIEHVCKMKGGLVAAQGNRVLAECALPVGGLMSEKPMSKIQEEMEKLLDQARKMGSHLKDPFMTLSFMSLEVIPELKLTDQGLVDTQKMKFVDLTS
ncbi:MAG: adenine deaminase [Acidobacteria bacterium]|nr:MAG: adenine deaminase [Acidobacteriota bacterium]